MKRLYFDCFAGISGDMVTGSLLDAGLDFDLLLAGTGKLELSGYKITSGKTEKCGITGTSFHVDVTAPQPARNLEQITSIITSSGLDEPVKKDACGIFRLLGEAESTVHGIPVEKVHFHEIGAVDSIIDICCAAIAINSMGIEEIHCSPVNTGSGCVKAAHGVLPVPAPATARILRGMTIYSSGTPAELTTPTGAAILKYYSKECGPLESMKTLSTGYGAGSRDFDFPNMLRVFIGETSIAPAMTDEITELETSIDDMSPELFSPLFESLLQSGALDVNVIPAYMKKNRPGFILKVLVRNDDAERLAGDIFRASTTSGIRYSRVSRMVLERDVVNTETEFGTVRIKVHKYAGKVITVSPEYEDCRELALKHNVPVKTVYTAAVAASHSLF